MDYDTFKEAAVNFIRRHPDLVIMNHDRAEIKKMR